MRAGLRRCGSGELSATETSTTPAKFTRCRSSSGRRLVRVVSHHCRAVVVQLVVIVCDETCDTPLAVVATLIRPAVDLMLSGYVEPQVHPFDRFFYNRSSHSYTVERFLDDLTDRYGGVDSILIWPTYPMIGADDRNQFDMIKAMPGTPPDAPPAPFVCRVLLWPSRRA